jgi:hypothetical protein
MKVGAKTFKVHLDGYDITDALAGKPPSPRHEFFQVNDEGGLIAISVRALPCRITCLAPEIFPAKPV